MNDIFVLELSTSPGFLTVNFSFCFQSCPLLCRPPATGMMIQKTNWICVLTYLYFLHFPIPEKGLTLSVCLSVPFPTCSRSPPSMEQQRPWHTSCQPWNILQCFHVSCASPLHPSRPISDVTTSVKPFWTHFLLLRDINLALCALPSHPVV